MKLTVIAYNETYGEWVCENKKGERVNVAAHLIPTSSRLRSCIGLRYKLSKDAEYVGCAVGDGGFYLPFPHHWTLAPKKAKKVDKPSLCVTEKL